MVFTYNQWKNLQNVNEDNMNGAFYNSAMELTSYFKEIPCICSGIGLIEEFFGQVGTTNVFNIGQGYIRFNTNTFINGDNSFEIEDLFGGIESQALTVTVGSGTRYVCAQVSATQIDTYRWQVSASLLTTAKTLAEVNADTTLVALYAIVNNTGVYTVSTNANCAYNYNYFLTAHDFVESLNSLTGRLNLTSTDSSVTITPSGQNINLAARAATDAVTGIIEIATQAEVNARADYTKAVTPATLGAFPGITPNQVPSRVICYQYAGDPKSITWATYRNYSGPVLYTPTSGTKAINVIGIGGGSGARKGGGISYAGSGGGGFWAYVLNPTPEVVVVGAGSAYRLDNNWPAAGGSSAYGGGLATGGYQQDGGLGYCAIGIVGGGEGGMGLQDNLQCDMPGGNSAFGLSGSQRYAIRFPGGGGWTHAIFSAEKYNGGNGCVWILEYD